MKNATTRPGLGRVLLVFGLVIAAIAVLSRFGEQSYPSHAVPTQEKETYSLVHARGNDETIVAKGLSQRDCNDRKKDNIAVAEALGIHSERLGVGSITCLPESVFSD